MRCQICNDIWLPWIRIPARVGWFWILPSGAVENCWWIASRVNKIVLTANHILFYFFNAYIWSKTHGKVGTLPPTYIFVIVACGGTAHCDIATSRKHVLWRRLGLSCFLGFENFTVVFDRCQVGYHSSNIASDSWSNHQLTYQKGDYIRWDEKRWKDQSIWNDTNGIQQMPIYTWYHRE